MATKRQIEANRANARKSTGPQSAGGKARASRNARRHGLSAAVTITDEVLEMCALLAGEGAASPADDAGFGPLTFAPRLVDVALAEVSLRRARLEATAADAEIARLIASDAFFGTPKQRGIEAALAELGLDAATRARMAPLVGPEVILSADMSPMDPVTLALHHRHLMQRYVVQAEAERSRALASLMAAENEEQKYKTNPITTLS